MGWIDRRQDGWTRRERARARDKIKKFFGEQGEIELVSDRAIQLSSRAECAEVVLIGCITPTHRPRGRLLQLHPILSSLP